MSVRTDISNGARRRVESALKVKRCGTRPNGRDYADPIVFAQALARWEKCR